MSAAAFPSDAEGWRVLLAGPPYATARALRAAAEAGVALAQLHYGQCLLDGRGVEAAPAEALRWFHAAATAGEAQGMNMVGRCIELGWGAAADPALAAPWYRAAAERGLDWGMYNLATLLALGRGVVADRAEALDWFRRAGALGHAKSLTMIGSFYEDGWVVARDRGLAADFYARGAGGGDFRGMFNHARMLVERDRRDEAADWIARALAAGTPRFVAQVEAWLSDRPEPGLRGIGDKDATFPLVAPPRY